MIRFIYVNMADIFELILRRRLIFISTPFSMPLLIATNWLHFAAAAGLTAPEGEMYEGIAAKMAIY